MAGHPADDYRFDVFISYSRRDTAFARRLQRALDNYTPPKDLPVPHRRLRVFRDESDFRGNEYGAALESMLKSAATLLVVCSPSSRASGYVGGEIATFASLRGPEHIASVLLAGHPNNEAGHADAEHAFHHELISRLPVPLAADYRGWDEKRDRVDRDRFEAAWFKLLADIYAVERRDIEGREKQRQSRTRRIRAALAGALIVVLASLTIWALVSRSQAITQGNTAQSRFLAMQSMSGAHSFDVAMLLAVAAHRTAPTFEAWEALFVGLQRQQHLQRFLYGVDATVEQIVVARDGGCVAAWTKGQRTTVWDLPAGTRRAVVPGRAMPDSSCTSLVIASTEGNLEARLLQEGGPQLWSDGPAGGSVTAWATDPTGTSLAVAYAGGRLVVRDMKDGRIRSEHSAAASTWRYVRFSADGQQLAAIDQQAMVHRWSLVTVAPPSASRCSSASPDVFALSPDLRWCAAGGPGYFAIRDMTRAGAGEIDLGPEWILALDFSPDGRTLMAGVQGGGLRFQSIGDTARDGRGARPVMWSEHRSDVTAAAYGPDGRAIVTASRDDTVIVWGTAATPRLVSEIEVRPEPSAIAVNANMPLIAIGTTTGDVLASRDGSGHLFDRMSVVGEPVTALALGDSGEVLAGTAGGRLLSVTSHSEPRVLAADRQERVVRIRLNDDQSRAAVIRADGSVSIWDLVAGTLVASVGGGGTAAAIAGGMLPGVDVAFEPGGARVVSVHGGSQAFLWSSRERSPQMSALPFRPTSFFTSVAFAAAPGPMALGTGMYEEDIVLLDATRAEVPLARLPSHNSGKVAVTALAFSPDARVLFSGLFDGATAVWDVAGRRRIGEIHQARGAIVEVSYARDGSAVTAVTNEGVVLRWNLDPARWLDMACAVANRDLSSEERARFMDGGGPEACP